MKIENNIIGIISDSPSFFKKKQLCKNLEECGFQILDLGVFSDSEEYNYSNLALIVANTIQQGNIIGCVAICITGNAFQINLNKININASPIMNDEMLVDAVKTEKAIVINLSSVASSQEELFKFSSQFINLLKNN